MRRRRGWRGGRIGRLGVVSEGNEREGWERKGVGWCQRRQEVQSREIHRNRSGMGRLEDKSSASTKLE